MYINQDIKEFIQRKTRTIVAAWVKIFGNALDYSLQSTVQLRPNLQHVQVEKSQT